MESTCFHLVIPRCWSLSSVLAIKKAFVWSMEGSNQRLKLICCHPPSTQHYLEKERMISAKIMCLNRGHVFVFTCQLARYKSKIQKLILQTFKMIKGTSDLQYVHFNCSKSLYFKSSWRNSDLPEHRIVTVLKRNHAK